MCPWQLESSASISVRPFAKKAGERRYTFSVWMRRENGAKTVEGRVRLDVPAADVLRVGSTPLMTEWGISSVTLDVSPDLEAADLELLVTPGNAPNGECFVIDDATLVRTRDAGP